MPSPRLQPSNPAVLLLDLKQRIRDIATYTRSRCVIDHIRQGSVIESPPDRRCRSGHFMSAVPHYGLRYGSAPATGTFQRLRGRPPLVSPLKACMRRSFTAVTQVQIPSGSNFNCSSTNWHFSISSADSQSQREVHTRATFDAPTKQQSALPHP
jgi:hypothetical protein